MKKMIESEVVLCDVCGEPVEGYGFIVAHNFTGEVIYESKIVGDYCPKHADLLLERALASMPLHERYDRIEDTQDAIRDEIEVIEGTWTRKQGCNERTCHIIPMNSIICKCSACDFDFEVAFVMPGYSDSFENIKYCPNCGAKVVRENA